MELIRSFKDSLDSFRFTWTHLASLGITWTHSVSLSPALWSQGKGKGLHHKIEKGKRPTSVSTPFLTGQPTRARTHARQETLSWSDPHTPQPPTYIIYICIFMHRYIVISEGGGWIQPGNCFVSLVHACARWLPIEIGCQNWGRGLSLFPFNAGVFPFSLKRSGEVHRVRVSLASSSEF